MSRNVRSSPERIIDLAAGAPDIATPAIAAEAAKTAVDLGHTRYTGSAGILELREAVVSDLARRKGVRFEPSDVMVAGGAKLTLFCILSALSTRSGTFKGVVVHPTPHYGGYPSLITRAGLVSRRVETSAADGYKLTPGLLADALDPSTAAVILNAPGNPTGVMYSASELEELTDVIRARSTAVIISDEVYSRFAYDTEFVSPASIASVAERVVIVDGVSKAYGMTGWRVGYASGPSEIIAAAKRVNTEVANCASSVSQWAAAAALQRAPDDHLDVARHRRLRDIAFTAAAALPGTTTVRPSGGIYQAVQLTEPLIARLRQQPGTLAERILTLGGVRVPNDTSFGREGLIRVTFSMPEAQLADGFQRLSYALERF